MTRIRIGFAISVLIGAMYAAASIFDSMTQFGVGLVVASLGVIGYGLCDFVEVRHDELTAQAREAVWARRDGSK